MLGKEMDKSMVHSFWLTALLQVWTEHSEHGRDRGSAADVDFPWSASARV